MLKPAGSRRKAKPDLIWRASRLAATFCARPARRARTTSRSAPCSSHSRLRAFAVGMANTLRVSAAGIVLASVLGVIVGLMRLSHHGLVAWLGSAYVEVFRNTPLLIQLLTIYLLATELLPDSSGALAIEGVALLRSEEHTSEL